MRPDLRDVQLEIRKIFSYAFDMKFILGKETKLSAMLMMLLLCVGWAQPFLPHSCRQHIHCETSKSCCAPEKAVSVNTRHHSVTAELTDCHDSGSAHTVHVAIHTQDTGHQLPDRDCSAAVCYEWQHQLTVASFEILQATIYNTSSSPPGGERFSSLPSSGLFRPPRLPSIL
jgi:hypothetical protein